jgi:uncharacterized protein (DUF1800 family)
MNLRTLAASTTLAAALIAAPSAGDGAFHRKLSKDEQILHALDRLTYGPRPGDIAQVERIGLKKWVEKQLHPDSIRENAELAEKLAPLESLTMDTYELMEHYPPPALVKRIEDGKAAMPDDPLARAAVRNMMARYEKQKAGAAEKPAMSDQDKMELAERVRDILEPPQIFTLRNGTTDEKLALIASLPPEKLVQLSEALPPKMRGPLIAAAPPEVRRTLLIMNAPQQAVAADLTAAKLYRAIYSNRQLAEILDDFWFNHFNVFMDKGVDRYELTDYERNAIEPHVLGKFRDLLEATAKNPAMLFYLDNWQSRGPLNKPGKNDVGLNENYGRELLELHTLGVDGGYTQTDVTEVARCFTGWTIRAPRQGGGFFYNDHWHDKGAKVVLGVTIPAGGGIDDGEKVLDIVAESPATAHHISLELAQKFVADNPPKPLVDRMVKIFRTSHGDLREVMKTMLDSPEFWSQGAYHAKVKTPFEMVASAIRATNADVSDAFALSNQIAKLGEPIYRKLEPTGYSNVNSEWVSSSELLGRMNFALALAGNKVPGVHVDPMQSGADADAIARALLFRDASEQTRAAIQQSEGDKAPQPEAIAGLVLGSPDFQRR